MDYNVVNQELNELNEKINKNETKIKILSDIIDRQQLIINNNLRELSALREYISKNFENLEDKDNF